MQYLTDFKAKHAGPAEGKRPKLDKESSGGSISAKSGEMVEVSSGHRRAGSIGSMSSTSYANPLPSPGGLPLAFTAAGNQILGMRKPAGTSPNTESPPSQLPAGPKLRSGISTQSSTSDDSWVSRGDQTEAVLRTAQLSLVTAPSSYAPLTSLPPLETSSVDDNPRQSSRRAYMPGHRDALPPMNPDPSLYQQYRPPLPGMLPTAAADERWRTILPDAMSRQMPELPRPLQPPHPMGQSGSFGTAQLPPLISPERLSDPTHDHLQRTLPPPRLSSPREHTQGLPSVSRGANTSAQSSTGTPVAGSARADVPQLDRSESEAISTLAGLASTGNRGEGLESQDPRLTRR
jgi:hypothetical protein